MRRKDREITDVHEICAIIDCCKVFRVAASVNDIPYIVPLNFGYEYTDESFIFYFHCAGEGKKLAMFRENDRVCFEMDCDHALTPADIACGYGYNYRSVVGSGRVEVVEDMTHKKRILAVLMKHQTGERFIFTNEQANSVTVCRIRVTELAAKQRAN